MKKKLIVIAGPTASGKTAFAIRLALQLCTEIVSADSRQVFREMRIGTAQPTDDELRTVTHHLVGHLRITEDYNAAKYASEANQVISALFKNYNIVILCGGSGLYIDALIEGLDNIPEVPSDIRYLLIKEFELNGVEWLRNEAKACDPDWFSSADQQNPRRLLRCVEVYRASGKTLSSLQQGKSQTHDWNVLKIGLELPRETLYERINQRVLKMVETGLFEEASALFDQRQLKSLQTVGYREVFEFMEGRITKEESIALVQQHTRNYAKRQLTWFKKDKDISWINPNNPMAIDDVLIKVRENF